MPHYVTIDEAAEASEWERSGVLAAIVSGDLGTHEVDGETMVELRDLRALVAAEKG